MCNTLYIYIYGYIWKSGGHFKVQWSCQCSMDWAKSLMVCFRYKRRSPMETKKKIVSSRHDCIIVYVVQEFKINKMAAEGYLTYWPIHFWQSERKSETNSLGQELFLSTWSDVKINWKLKSEHSSLLNEKVFTVDDCKNEKVPIVSEYL